MSFLIQIRKYGQNKVESITLSEKKSQLRKVPRVSSEAQAITPLSVMYTTSAMASCGKETVNTEPKLWTFSTPAILLKVD